MSGASPAVVFDFGGVLISAISSKFPTLAAQLDIPLEDTVELFLGPMFESGDHPWHRCERGELAVADLQPLVAAIASERGLTLRGDEMEFLFRPMYEYHQNVLDRIRKLRADGIATALLTNSVREYRPILESELDFDEFFDVVVDSSEVGMRKPEPRIFEFTAAALGVPHEAVIYLDDFAGNIAGAERMGWTTIHVSDPTAALTELDRKLALAVGDTEEDS